MDEDGHGAHVAGTIAARLDQKEVAGVSPRARILPVKVLGPEGEGSTSDVVRGIVWAVDLGALDIGGGVSAPVVIPPEKPKKPGDCPDPVLQGSGLHGAARLAKRVR